MNIWYLSAYDQPEGHSARTYDYSVQLANTGHTVTMFTNSYCHFTHRERLTDPVPWKVEMFGPVQVVWLKTFPYTGNGWRRGVNMLSNMRRCLQVAEALTDHPDVIVGPSVPLFTALAAYRIARLKKAAFVFEVRDVWPQALVDLHVMSKWSPVYAVFRIVEQFLYRKADRISAVLPLTGQHVAHSGSDASKVTWIPNGLPMARFETLPPYDGGQTDRLTVMYIGGFSATHSVGTILAAAAMLANDTNQALRFIFIGTGQERAVCETQARAFGLRNVEFRDPIPKAAVPVLLAEADLLIASVKDTAHYQFGINSNKLFDYLASGRPILFAGQAPNDPVKESGAGLTIPPENPTKMAEAIRTVFEMTPRERRRLGENGRRYAEEHLDVKILAGRLEALLNDAVQCALKRRSS